MIRNPTEAYMNENNDKEKEGKVLGALEGLRQLRSRYHY